MNLQQSEAIEYVRRWEAKASKIRGSLFTNSQELQIAFLARVYTDCDRITLTSDTGFEVSMTPTQGMTFSYDNAILEIKAPMWRCILYEPKD